MGIVGLVTLQGNDRSAETEQVANDFGLSLRGIVAQFIAEGGATLNERAERWGNWPDVSFGGYQQTVAYAVDVDGNKLGDGSASNENIALVRDYFFNYSNAVRVAARQLAGYYKQFISQGMTEEWAFKQASSRYNGGPFMPFAVQQASPHLIVPYEQNPNRNWIAEAWELAAQYVDSSEAPPVLPPISNGFAPIDVRDRFPFERGEYPERSLWDVSGVVYHHGADGHQPLESDEEGGSQEHELAILDSYHRLHVDKNGWPAIAYSVAIGRSGRAYLLNALNLTTYHCGNWDGNVHNAGIVFIGDYRMRRPPDDMIATAIHARRWIAEMLGTGLNELPYTGHQQWSTTECPGAWWLAENGVLAELAAPPEEPSEPGEGGDESGGDESSASDPLAELVSWRGYVQGDWLNGMNGDLQALRELVDSLSTVTAKSKAENAKLQGIRDALIGKIEQGIAPRMSKLGE